MMDEDKFQNIFTRSISSASVTTAKAEEKRLADDQYVPPPGHISFLKERFSDGHAGEASLVTLGGVRMDESRTWKHASEIFKRIVMVIRCLVNDLLRLKSFQVTTTSGRTCSGSVTTFLEGYHCSV